MPKRTNTFQQLIHYIYTQLIPTGAIISESAEILERESSDLREVDILIEQEIAGIKIRIAIECRDYKRANTKEWIDALIGKYSDLQIDKVIAVSSSGFTSEAIRKAKAHGIETHTLKEALDTNWIKEFLKLGILVISDWKILEEWVRIETDPTIYTELDLNDFVIDSSEQKIGTLEELVQDGLCTAFSKLEAYSNLKLFENFKTVADLDKHLLLEIPLIPPDFYLITSNKNKHQIHRVIYIFRLCAEAQKINISKQTYNKKALITTGAISEWRDGKNYKIHLVQVTGKNEFKVFWEPILTENARKTLRSRAP